MTVTTWASIAAQLRAIGIAVPVDTPADVDLRPVPEGEAVEPEPVTQADTIGVASRSADTPVPSADDIVHDEDLAVAKLLAAAKAGGVCFYERVADGELVANGLGGASADLRDRLKASRHDIRCVLMPNGGTQSLDLLVQSGVEIVYVSDEHQAEVEVARLCSATETLGLDLETAPRPEFLPVHSPIAITNDGRRSFSQAVMDTTAALDPFRAEIRLLQVAAEVDGRMVALVVDLRRVPLHSAALAPIWKCKLVGHNLSFDGKMLVAGGVDIRDENVIDSILMAGLILRGCADKRRDGSRRPSLATAVKEALGIDLPKTSQLSPWWRDRLSTEQIAYAALDAVFALKLADVLQPRIEKLPLGLPALNRLCRTVMPVARMELAGITLDRDGLAAQADGWAEELAALASQIADLGIANPSSGPQLAAWLTSNLELVDRETGSNWLRSWPRTPSGAMSTQAKHLKRLVGAVPGAELLARHSKLAQLRSNFGEKLLGHISSETGRLHGSFMIAMAKSGRFSSSKPNVQNIPKSTDMRSLFVAPPGKVLVVADYSQLELRVMAAIAKDRVMAEAYRSGLDLHAVTAAGMLGITPDQFDPANPAHKEARQKSKSVNFGVIYGSGPGGLREFARDAYGVLMSLDEAQRVIDKFLATYPGVARWQREQADRTRRSRTVSTVGGRVYRFGWEPGGEFKRNLALNLPVQGTAAEIALEAMIRIDRRLRAELQGRASLVLQVHDEFVVEVNNDTSSVDTTIRVLEEEMTAAFLALLPDAPTTGLVEAHPGPNWAAAKG